MKIILTWSYLALSLLLSSYNAWAEDVVIVPVGDAGLKSSGLTVGVEVQTSRTPRAEKLIGQIASIIQNDFSFYKKVFQVVKNPIERPTSSLDYDLLSRKQIEVYILLSTKEEQGKVTVVGNLFDAAQKKLLTEQSLAVTELDMRDISHQLSDAFYRQLTNKESIFKSKIIFVSDRTSIGSKIRKELYVMDFDGGNTKRLTFHNGTVISPAVSHSGKKVLYSLIREEEVRRRNINLYLLDLETMQNKLISSRPGINSGAVFMDNDNEILLTLSHTGNAEIYRFNLTTSQLTPVTKHFAIDVDPSINRDGTLMTFLSGRSGNPMIYTLDPRGTEKQVKRISFVGQFNAAPRFSPDGKEIVFSSWLDDCFDLFRIDADGRNLSRLTKNFGSNEDATYSNDGEFIAFTSKRILSRTKATQNIYIIDREGEVLGNITQNFGNCTGPRWSR